MALQNKFWYSRACCLLLLNGLAAPLYFNLAVVDFIAEELGINWSSDKRSFHEILK